MQLTKTFEFFQAIKIMNKRIEHEFEEGKHSSKGHDQTLK